MDLRGLAWSQILSWRYMHACAPESLSLIWLTAGPKAEPIAFFIMAFTWTELWLSCHFASLCSCHDSQLLHDKENIQGCK